MQRSSTAKYPAELLFLATSNATANYFRNGSSADGGGRDVLWTHFLVVVIFCLIFFIIYPVFTIGFLGMFLKNRCNKTALMIGGVSLFTAINLVTTFFFAFSVSSSLLVRDLLISMAICNNLVFLLHLKVILCSCEGSCGTNGGTVSVALGDQAELRNVAPDSPGSDEQPLPTYEEVMMSQVHTKPSANDKGDLPSYSDVIVT